MQSLYACVVLLIGIESHHRAVGDAQRGHGTDLIPGLRGPDHGSAVPR